MYSTCRDNLLISPGAVSLVRCSRRNDGTVVALRVSAHLPYKPGGYTRVNSRVVRLVSEPETYTVAQYKSTGPMFTQQPLYRSKKRGALGRDGGNVWESVQRGRVGG